MKLSRDNNREAGAGRKGRCYDTSCSCLPYLGRAHGGPRISDALGSDYILAGAADIPYAEARLAVQGGDYGCSRQAFPHRGAHDYAVLVRVSVSEHLADRSKFGVSEEELSPSGASFLLLQSSRFRCQWFQAVSAVSTAARNTWN